MESKNIELEYIESIHYINSIKDRLHEFNRGIIQAPRIENTEELDKLKGQVSNLTTQLEKIGLDRTKYKTDYSNCYNTIDKTLNDIMNIIIQCDFDDEAQTKINKQIKAKFSKDKISFTMSLLNSLSKEWISRANKLKNLNTNITEITQEIAQLNEENARLKGISEAKGDDNKTAGLLQKYADDLNAKDKEISKLNGDLIISQSDVTEYMNSVKTLKDEIEDLNGQVLDMDDKNERINQRLQESTETLQATNAKLIKCDTLLKQTTKTLRQGVDKANAARALALTAISGGGIFSSMAASTWLMLLVVVLLILLFYIIYYCPKDKYNNINNNIDSNINYLSHEREFIY